jgi:hypothetical protein
LLITVTGIPGPKAAPDQEEATSSMVKFWRKEYFEQNVIAGYFIVVIFLPLLQSRTNSCSHLFVPVIVILSMSAIMRNTQGHFSYNIAKGGHVHLTQNSCR